MTRRNNGACACSIAGACSDVWRRARRDNPSAPERAIWLRRIMTIVTAASSPRSFCATNVSFQVLDDPRDCVDPVVDFSTDFISMPIRRGALHVLRARAAPPKGPGFCLVQLGAAPRITHRAGQILHSNFRGLFVSPLRPIFIASMKFAGARETSAMEVETQFETGCLVPSLRAEH